MEKSETRNGTVSLLLQDAPVEVHRDLWRFWLLPGEPESGVVIRKAIDPKKPIAWRELDKLPELIELEYQGVDAGIIAYVTKRAGLKTMRWTAHGQSTIDLSKSKLTELSIDTSGPLTLAIPPTLKMLRLTHAKHLPKLTVKTDDAGARLEIYVWEPKSKVKALPGLASLGGITIAGTSSADLAPLAQYTKLESLAVWGIDTGVAIGNLKALAKLPALKRLELRHAYHTDFSALPHLPALESFAIDGIRAPDAAHVKKLYAGNKRLRVSGVRTDAWLKKNADNPFREWEGPIAARAATAYRTARTAIDKGAPAEATLSTFIATFNKVEKDIDTIMREEIGEAFDALAADLKVPSKRAIGWFEKWRDF